MQPQEFINLKYKPKGKDLICLFRVEPNKISMKEAAATIALESSVGTWTDLKLGKTSKRLAAKVFNINGNWIKIAYPQELFEEGNAPNVLSSIAGNIFGMKAVKNLRLEDVSFSKKILSGFQGPKFGIEGVRKNMKIKNRPLIGTIIKPKLGLDPYEHAKSAYESWVGGCDLVKADENLANQKFNDFEERLARTLEYCDKAEEQTGLKKGYIENVTAETKEMMRRAQLAEDLGSKYIMIDFLTAGFSALQTLREADFKLSIHCHRALHGAMTRNPKHGISMMVLADFTRLIGVDQLHVGTGVGKLDGNLSDIKELVEEIEDKKVKATNKRLTQNWGKIKSVMAVSSGGLCPLDIPKLIKNFGNNLIIQMGGGIHSHTNGTNAGARAAKQALNATLKGITLKKYAKDHAELRLAIEKWGK